MTQTVRTKDLRTGDIIVGAQRGGDLELKVTHIEPSGDPDEYGSQMYGIGTDKLDFLHAIDEKVWTIKRRAPEFAVGTVVRFNQGNVGVRLEEGVWGMTYPHSRHRYAYKFLEGSPDESVQSDIDQGKATIIYNPKEDA